ATLFRWAADLFASGRAGQHLAGRIGAAAERRAERVPEAPAADAARAAVQLLPAPVRPEDIAGGGSAVVVIGRQQECICAALEVMGRARAEGKVRNAKLLLPRRPRS
ncbi:MAG: hypothetical protein IRZ13_15060, partial [Acetobacteraceae bacterium]|nr:hypothetical protein [Acetobacteraceae bacterium]